MDNNVGWDNRGVGLYTEDGNEMQNVISNNVFICHNIYYCRIEWQNVLGVGPAQKEGGLFMFGMANDVIGNHVVGHEHGVWTQGASQNSGRPFGFSEGKVCNQFTPFGKFKGNVFHDCQRFGTYVDFQFPRNVVQDVNGFITEQAFGPTPSCEAFTNDGSDNGHLTQIEDQFDWHNTFVGGYFVGDISFVRYNSVNNGHAIYWKFSKNFADPNGYHMKDSIIANDPNDSFGQLKMMLPGGSFAFRMKNVTFIGGPFLPGGGVINSPQHCGLVDHNNGIPGAQCNVEILMEDVNFDKVLDDWEGNRKYVFYGASGGNPLAPLYLSNDNSLGGHQSVVSHYLDGFANVAGCSYEYLYDGYACDNVPIRRLTIWAPDMGDLTLRGKGYEVAPNYDFPVYGANGGILKYNTDQQYVYSPWKMLGGGYAANVIVGETYTLEGLSWTGKDIVVEISDPVTSEFFGASKESEGINLNVQLSNGLSFSCYPNAGESRKFHASWFIDERALRSGNMGECALKFRDISGNPLKPTIPTIPPSGDCDCPGAEYDPSCAAGGLGCMACGHDNCRYCGGDNWSPCKYTSPNSNAPTTTESMTSEMSSNPYPTTPNVQTTTTQSQTYCSSCDNAEYDNRCLDPSSDPYGGLGCKACGIDGCRFCGFGNMPDCL